MTIEKIGNVVFDEDLDDEEYNDEYDEDYD